MHICNFIILICCSFKIRSTLSRVLLLCLLRFFKKQTLVFNIASGSEANMTILCEMEFFNFLWLIWVLYLPLAPILYRTIDPLDPRSYPQSGVQIYPKSNLLHKVSLQPYIRFHWILLPSLILTYDLTYLRSRTFPSNLGSKNGPKVGHKWSKFKF